MQLLKFKKRKYRITTESNFLFPAKYPTELKAGTWHIYTSVHKVIVSNIKTETI